ncbi:MAG: hypothetical protein K2I64_05875 [Muribaculaceae bacterium]|nr:hypothetical protein [Muribaculaceae bacterium]
MKIEISDRIKAACPGYRMIKIECDVTNSPTPEALRTEMARLTGSIAELMEIEDINRRPAIAATRGVYKSCGKDPNRYRPSQEQLNRRVVRGLGLYSIDSIVDAFNLLSLKSGYAIGAFDVDKISGDSLTLGVGEDGEPYEGIGRGTLNIAGMPVIRDNIGGIGTPTSDNERTKVTGATSRLLVTIHIFSEEMPVAATVGEATRLLTDYCNATDINVEIISA